MPRPRKWRSVCALPEITKFGPLGSGLDDSAIVEMTVDEYETIRLIDREGLTQLECAEQMNVARTTVQGIYDTARKKIAESLVEGKILFIQGGEYRLCDHSGPHRRQCGRGCRLGHGHHAHRQGDNTV